MAEPKGKRRRAPRGFYGEVLSEAERLELPRAREMEGLDEEIALLRVKLRRLLEEQPENFPMMLRGVTLLVRAVKTRYRLSKKAEEDLYQSVVGVLEGVGSALGLEGFDGT